MCPQKMWWGIGKGLQTRGCRGVCSTSRLEPSAGVGAVTGMGGAYKPVSNSVLLFRLISLNEVPTQQRPQAFVLFQRCPRAPRQRPGQRVDVFWPVDTNGHK